MIVEKDNIRCEAVFNDDHTHRFLWKRVWNKDKPLAAVIMLNPCQADTIITDTTTSLVINNVARLERFGGVAVLNLFSLLTPKLNFRWNSDEDLNQQDNDNQIRRTAAEAGSVILAWGKSVETNQRVAQRASRVLELLSGSEEKLLTISDGTRENLHPLTPALRSQWQLKPFDRAAYDKAQEKPDPKAKKDTPIAKEGGKA